MARKREVQCSNTRHRCHNVSPGQHDEALSELARFLKVEARQDVKAAALQHVLGLTGSDAGCRQLMAAPELLLAARPDSALADPCCMTLSNLSRAPAPCRELWRRLEEGPVTVDDLVTALCQRDYNTAGCHLNYLGPLLSNLTQLPEARRYMLSRDRVLFQRLLPFTEYKESLVRRGGVVGAIKNCCFETESHLWLLGDEVDLLPRLLLPLTGPEPYDDEDMEQLPVDLQYMDESKTREPDVDIRRILLEAMTQLCATTDSRELVRGKGAYLILREYHKWETDEEALRLCEELVNILIKTEPEIGVDNLKAVDIPSDVAARLDQVT
ncbi:protein HGH1 homolog [Pollicipes pollicipes]|uniref:protein HGH1 homolog n=1 Tax=Pollicipes pollicipes TaxID=41117 RepID=UPI001885564C|nr:protein HGH1 homolog [Pollicipes pollicipes]